MKHARVMVASFIGLGVVTAGCGSSGVTSTPAKTPTPAPTSSTPSAPKAGVGSTINLSDSVSGRNIAVTVVRVADPDPSTNQFETPPAGDRFVSIQFRIVNTGKQAYQDDPQIEATAKDAAGQNLSLEPVVSTVAGPQMPSNVNLAPGGTALGYITFDVPAGDSIAQAQYSINAGVSGNTGEWQITSSQAPTHHPAPPPQSTTPSGAQAVVESYFAAINSGNYALAWSLGGKNIAHGSYNSFVQGFAGTASDAVTILSVNGNTVTVQLTATQTDGSQKSFSGTYTVQNGVIVAADIH